jgi:crotonobetainyl-CoA:carnitine CoA-transferase CaiB-like acyl-CoA transferase
MQTSDTPPAGMQPEDAPLDGFVVIDFTRVLSGPYCTRLLADLGATVIKIERPGEGDETRYVLPQLDPDKPDQSPYFARMNAGKRSIAVNFAHADARDLVHDLVRDADVVVENFSPGVMTRYGIDWPALSETNPSLVYCAISGFGQTGPLRGLQAYGHLINAFSGMMELERGGELAPRAANLQAADVLAGGQAFGAICAALLRRSRTGRGAFIDVSMLECLIAADDVNFPALLSGAPIKRQPRPGMVVHPIGDRHLAMQIAGVQSMWTRLTGLMKRPELHDDPRFATQAGRRRNWPELAKIVGEWLESFDSVDEAVEALSAARVPNVPMLNPEEVIEHPHLAAREAFPAVAHPVAGSTRVTATPFRFDGAPINPAGPVPWRIGEHTDQVLRERLGYSAEKVAALLERGVVRIP